uniref:Uncharacterized protein n=1 Tax=Oryza punctata TaxID=4537 RepID=A0A0E0LT48_ORYPU
MASTKVARKRSFGIKRNGQAASHLNLGIHRPAPPPPFSLQATEKWRARAPPSPPPRRRDAEAPPPPPVAGTDMLMFLPPEILDIILARIPFEKLVRTCCLSREWRRRWESVPFLDIRLPRGSATVPDARALWRCAAPVRGFRAYVRTGHFYRAALWLRALARKRVRELTLDSPPAYALLDPALFFSGAALVRLHLHHCHMPPAPRGFPGFPNLFSLPFVGGGEQLEHLIAAAPRLAELSLDIVVAQPIREDGGFDRVCEWAIHAPNLRVLKMEM